jgi:3-phosphoshikimate 1-carboxyvinyltransferase
LLYLTPYLDATSEISVGEPGTDQPGVLVSRPLIDQTMEALGQFHISLRADFEAMKFTVYGGQCGLGSDRMVNADWPSAAALLCAVAVAGGMATIYGLELDAQGERRTKDVLTQMGCDFSNPNPRELVIHSKGELRAIRFDGDLATDAVLAMVGAACLAEGTSRFTGIGNLRLKECDRIREPLEELAKIGVKAHCGTDWIEVTGRPEGYQGGMRVDARGDHRVAQMLAIVGQHCSQGLVITGAEHISKSYPDFFEDLQRLGVHLKCLTPES